MLGKLLGVATVGSTLASVELIHRFLSGITKIIVLAIVSAFMLCALVISAFIVFYFSLVHYGLDPYVAVITIGAVAVFITTTLVLVTIDQTRQLRDLPHFSLCNFKNDLPDIGHIIRAFIDGLLSPRKKNI